MTPVRTLGGTLAASLVLVSVAAAQTPVELDELRAPTAPAFALLDVTPATIDRPQNPRSVTVNLLDAVSRSGGLPRSVAFEVAPYWLTPRPELTFEAYQRPGMLAGMAQTLAISVATTPLRAVDDATTEADGTSLGLGVRVGLWTGRPSPQVTERIAELAALNGDLLDLLDAGAPAEEVTALRGQIVAQTLEIQALDAQRVGFSLVLAAGQTWNVPGDDFGLRQRDRWGVWLTPAYRVQYCRSAVCEGYIDAIGVVRAHREPGADTGWDVGGRVAWQSTRALTLSAEVVRRQGGRLPAATHRTVGILEYRLTDAVLLYGSFGTGFEEPAGRRPLVSILGLNLGLGRKPVVQAGS